MTLRTASGVALFWLGFLVLGVGAFPISLLCWGIALVLATGAPDVGARRG